MDLVPEYPFGYTFEPTGYWECDWCFEITKGLRYAEPKKKDRCQGGICNACYRKARRQQESEEKSRTILKLVKKNRAMTALQIWGRQPLGTWTGKREIKLGTVRYHLHALTRKGALKKVVGKDFTTFQKHQPEKEN